MPSTYLGLPIISPGSLAHIDHREAVECRCESGCPTSYLPVDLDLGVEREKLALRRDRGRGAAAGIALSGSARNSPNWSSPNVLPSHTSHVRLSATLWSPPDFSVHGILQARTLGWVAMSSSRGSFRPRDPPCISYVSALAGGFFTTGPGLPLIARVGS